MFLAAGKKRARSRVKLSRVFFPRRREGRGFEAGSVSEFGFWKDRSVGPSSSGFFILKHDTPSLPIRHQLVPSSSSALPILPQFKVRIESGANQIPPHSQKIIFFCKTCVMNV